MVATPKPNAAFGLSTTVLSLLQEIFGRFPAIDKVLIYGSRARGDFRPGSDIDMAVFAPELSEQQLAALWLALEESPIAFPMDLVHFDQLENPELKKAIEREGVAVYTHD